MTKVLVYGGSFNPPHIGHVWTAFHCSLMEESELTLIIPTFVHPYGKALLDFEHRFRMCELAMKYVPNIQISRIEQELGGVSWTLRTIRELLRRNPDWEITLAMGSDVHRDFSNWEDYFELQELITVFPIGRMSLPLWNDPNPIVPDISSTRIREMIEATGSMDELVHLLYPPVIGYIEENGLYGYKNG